MTLKVVSFRFLVGVRSTLSDGDESFDVAALKLRLGFLECFVDGTADLEEMSSHGDNRIAGSPERWSNMEFRF
jgi:hypothetical protein